MMETNKPIINEFRNGISIAGWKSERGISFKINKRYQDKEGNWKDSNYFYENDLQDLFGLIMKVQNKLNFMEAHR